MARAKAAAKLTVHDEGEGAEVVAPAAAPAAIERPSDQIIREAAKEMSCVDAQGRTIVFGRPPILMQSRYMRLLRPEEAANQAFMTTFFLPATWCRSINGEKILPPSTIGEVEAIIQRLDYDGCDAILKAFEALGQRMVDANKAQGEAEEQVRK